MQVILGAGGDIGRFLAKELRNYTSQIRLVSRNPQKVNDDDILFPADLLDANAVNNAVKGAEVAYLVAGLKYDIKVWRAGWPVIMKNVIQACLEHQCRLVFFDNVYMYDKSAIPDMKEDSPINPPSEKGKVRAQLVEMINDAMNRKGLKALIARSADFYGPGSGNSVLNILVLDNFKKGKAANWQSNASMYHSFTYIPDAAKATALLGNTEKAYNQVWHLPTSAELLTGRDFIKLAATKMNKKPKLFLLTPFLLNIAGIFSPTIRELKEMQYQNDQHYFFNSEKFNKAFNFTPTPYSKGIEETLAG